MTLIQLRMKFFLFCGSYYVLMPVEPIKSNLCQYSDSYNLYVFFHHHIYLISRTRLCWITLVIACLHVLTYNLFYFIYLHVFLQFITYCTFNSFNSMLGIVSHIMSFLFEKSDGRMLLRPAAQGNIHVHAHTLFYDVCIGERSGSVGEDLFNNCFLLLQYLSVDNMNVRAYSNMYIYISYYVHLK